MATRIVITGQLAEVARHRMHTDGTHAVLVLIAQAVGPHVLAERAYGRGPAASYAAGNAASAMRRGHEITAHGAAIRLGRFEQHAVLRLEGVDFIEHAAPRAHHEPQSATADVAAA